MENTIEWVGQVALIEQNASSAISQIQNLGTYAARISDPVLLSEYRNFAEAGSAMAAHMRSMQDTYPTTSELVAAWQKYLPVVRAWFALLSPLQDKLRNAPQSVDAAQPYGFAYEVVVPVATAVQVAQAAEQTTAGMAALVSVPVVSVQQPAFNATDPVITAPIWKIDEPPYLPGLPVFDDRPVKAMPESYGAQKSFPFIAGALVLLSFL